MSGARGGGVSSGGGRCAREDRARLADERTRSAGPRERHGGEPARQLLGDEHLPPAVDRAIGVGAEHDVERHVERPVVGRHPQRLLAQGEAGRRLRAGPQLAADGVVDGVAYPRRAVVEEVVVLVVAVLGARVDVEARAQRLLDRRIERQLLHVDRPVLVLVRSEHRRQVRHRQPVGHAAVQEVEDQARPGEAEGPEVVDAIGPAAGAVVNPDRVVSELEERMIAGTERHHVDRQRILRRRLFGRRRGGDRRSDERGARDAGRGEEQRRRRQNRPRARTNVHHLKAITGYVAAPLRRNRRCRDDLVKAAASCRRPASPPARAPRSPSPAPGRSRRARRGSAR